MNRFIIKEIEKSLAANTDVTEFTNTSKKVDEGVSIIVIDIKS